MDQLEQLPFIYNSAKGAVHQAHATANALILINLCPAIFVLADSIHAAGLLGGPLKADNGLVGARRLALAAFNALALVDLSPAIAEADGSLGAGIGAVVRQAALAGVGHLVVGVRAGVAGIFDDVNQRRLVIFFPHCALVHTVGQKSLLRSGTQTMAHGQSNPLSHNGPLQEDGVPFVPHFTRQNLIRQFIDTMVVAAFVGELCHFRKNPLANISNPTVNVSHACTFLVLCILCHIALYHFCPFCASGYMRTCFARL